MSSVSVTNKKTSFDADSNADIPVLVDLNAGGDKIQVFRLDLGVGTAESRAATTVPVSPSLPSTATPATVTCANNTSEEVLAANSSRRDGAYICNTQSGIVFWVKEGAPAVIGEGVPLFYGGMYEVRTKAAVNAIQNSGASKDIFALEVT